MQLFSSKPKTTLNKQTITTTRTYKIIQKSLKTKEI